MTVDIKELKRQLEKDAGDFPWVRPECVIGYDLAMALREGKLAWFGLEQREALWESPVEVIPEYLSYSLIQNNAGGAAGVTGRELLDAVVWLALNIGSQYAVGTLAAWRNLLADVPLQESLHRVLVAVQEAAEPFVRDILRYLLWDFFGISKDALRWKERLSNDVSPECLDEIEGFSAL